MVIFEQVAQHAAISSYQPGFHASPEDWKRDVEAKPVRVQWDPERDWRLQPIADVRAIQIGLSGEAVERYVNQWIQNSSRLRAEMGKGNPIFDSFRDAATGQQIPTRGFLNAERNLLENHGWNYNPQTGAYHPPGTP